MLEELYQKYDLRSHALMLDQPKENKDYSVLKDYNNFKDIMTEKEYQECRRNYKNRKAKTYTCGSKIKEMIKLSWVVNQEKQKIIFGTATFSDEALALKEETRVKKLNKWLKENFLYIIVNKDFGDKTNREHYHFIALGIKEIENTGKKSKKGYELYELKEKTYTLGHEPDLEIINTEDKNKVKHYLMKLDKHSNKITAKSRLRVLQNRMVNVLFEKRKCIY